MKFVAVSFGVGALLSAALLLGEVGNSRTIENLWVTQTMAGGTVDVTCTDMSHWVYDSVYSVERDARQYVIRTPGVTVFYERPHVQCLILPNGKEMLQ
jgi:hypothetical protein